MLNTAVPFLVGMIPAHALVALFALLDLRQSRRR